MSNFSVLEPGRAQRRVARQRARRRRRRLFATLLVVILAVAVLLTLTTGQTADPARTVFRPQTAKRIPVAARRKAVVRPTYGIALGPAAEQVRPRAAFHLGSGILFDVWTGQVLWQQNPGRRLPIASLTKMMTALVVTARTNPHDRVLITRQALQYTGSGVGLLPLGHHVSELALLYGLLLPSGNDAAIALAQHVTHGDEHRFVDLMNAHAREMNLSCSHFASESGIVDRDNYSCTSDLAVLAHAILQQPVLSRIVASRRVSLPFPIKGGRLYLYNNNPLFYTGYPGTDGVKTGYTNAAGPCLVAAARRGHTWLGVVLLHSTDPVGEATKLLDGGFAKLGTR